VSLLLRDELRVVLSRDQLQLVRLSSKLTLKGWVYSLSEKKNIFFEVDAEEPWRNAINKLESELAVIEKKPDLSSIVLANQFLRYAIVDGDKALKSEAEQIAYVTHRLGLMYGESANTWDVRLDQEYAGAPYIASAVDRELIVELREIFKRLNMKLQSIQPCLMKAYNLCQSVFKDKSAWFVMFEHGNLCLAWLNSGHISTVRTIKVGEDWLEKLTEIIDRETYLSELDTGVREIFLMSFTEKKTDVPKNSDWKIYKITPEIPLGLFEHYDERFALAMCG
jgi:hypothetical protein